jgi:hypothetical protein
VTQRHGKVLELLARFARGHAYITVERKDPNGTWPDAKVHLHTAPIVTDVVIAHPNAPSHRQSALIHGPGHTAKGASKFKYNKYLPNAEAIQGRMLPFALETYGGYDKYALKLLKAIIDETSSPVLGPPRYFTMAKPTLLRLISASLQRENANIVLEWLHMSLNRALAKQICVAAASSASLAQPLRAPVSCRL